MRQGQRLDRRTYLSGLAVGASATVAGCLGALDPPEDRNDDTANGDDTGGNGTSSSEPTDGTDDELSTLDEDSQAATRFVNVAGRDAAGLSTWRDYRTFWTDALSQASSVQQEPPEAVNRIFQNSLENIPAGMHAVLFFEFGTTAVLGTTDQSYEGVILEETDTPWIPEQLRFEDETQVNVSEPYRADGVPVVAFVTQVRNRAGAGLAAIARTQPAIASKDGGRFSTVVDSTGTIVIDERDVEFVGQQYGDGPSETAIEQGTAGESGILNTVPIADELDGEYVAAFAPVDGIDWTVVLHAPAATVLDQSAEN
jgi:hypothetical protein